MRKSVWLMAAAAPLLAVMPVTQAGAADVDVALFQDPDPDQMSGEELWSHMTGLFFDDELAAMRPYAQELHSRTRSNPRGRSLALTMLGASALAEGNEEEALEHWEAANRVADVSNVLQLQLFATLFTGKHDLGGSIFDRMTVETPNVIQRMDTDLVRPFIYVDDGDRDDAMKRRIIKLAEMRYGEDDLLWLPAAAALYTLEADPSATDAAWALFDRVESPVTVQTSLMDRGYEALWPRIEAKYSAGLQTLWDERLAKQKAESEEDREELTGYLNYLLDMGDYARALEVSGAAMLPLDQLGELEDDNPDGWIVNHHALALDLLGRPDEADAAFAALVEPNLGDDEKYWVVSFAINWVEHLIGNERFERAAEKHALAEAAVETGGNAYAKQLVARQKYCILSKTGAAAADIAAARSIMMENADDAALATAEALICGGEKEAAIDTLIAGLASGERNIRIIEALQPFTMERSDPSIWTVDWSEIRSDPRLVAAFEEVARVLPEQYRYAHQTTPTIE